MSEDSRPRTGHGIAGILEGLTRAVYESTGLRAYVEPVPVRPQATSVQIVPRTVSFRGEGPARDNKNVTYTAMLGVELMLSGEGSGIEFMAEALDGSFLLGLLLEEPLTVEYGRGMYASFSAERSGQGRFFDSEGEGSRFCVYEEGWSGTLFFPVVAEKDFYVGRSNLDEPRNINL